MRTLLLGFAGSYLAFLSAACGGVTASAASDAGPTDGNGGGQESSVLPPTTCPVAQTTCPRGCADLLTDPFNCGTCSNACISGSCTAGQCTGAMPTPTGDAGPGLPPNPGGPGPTGSGSTVLAISKLYFGDTDRNGVFDSSAWKTYGLDIDGKVTTKASTDVCTLAAGASKTTQVDGNSGIDNSFGENILPILITTAGSNYSDLANASIQAGGSTMMLQLLQLGSGPNYAPLPGTLFHAGPTSAAPAWNGTDVRSIDSASAAGVTFAGGYMNARQWVGAPPIDASFDIHFWNVPGAPPLPMSHLQLTMVVDPSNATATQGTLSAVVSASALVAYLQSIAGSISTSLCSGSAFQSIAQQIEQASDILHDGTNEAGAICNAISIGLGFEASAVQLGGVVTLPTPPNPCP